RTDVARSQLAAALPNLDAPTRRQVEALLTELDAPAPSATFAALVADPELERRLAGLAARSGALRGGGGGFLGQTGSLRLVEVKRLSQELADRWGGALTSVFVVLGLFSIATGVMLTVLIFVLLAAERRSEMGITRALGAKRRHLILMFLYEGVLYDLAAAAVGLAVGVAVGIALVMVSADVLQGFGIQLEPHVEPRSLLLAYCLGAVITMLSIWASAWRASRLTIVSAIKDLPEPPRPPRRRTYALGPAMVLAGLLLAWWGLRASVALPMGGGVVLVVLGLAVTVRPWLALLGLSARTRDRVRYSLAGLLLLLYWLVPNDWLQVTGLRPLPRSMDLFFVAGLSLVLGAIWLLVYNVEVLTRLVGIVGMRARGGALLVRTALAFPAHHRFRTGMTVAMFGLVIFGMVVAAVLLTGTHRAYSDPDAMAGGFEVKVEQSSGDADIRRLLAESRTVKPEDFAAIGAVQSIQAEAIQLGDGARIWRQVGVNLVDDEFAQAVQTGFTARATDYPTDAAVWKALRENPGLAVVAGPAVRPRQAEPLPGSLFRLDGVAKEDRTMPPLPVWVRDPRGGKAVELTIIGVMDPRATFGPGLFTAQSTFAAAGAPPPQRATAYLRVEPGVSATEKTLALNLGLQDQGLRASEIGEDVRRILGLRMLLNDLLQAFIGVGLLAGIAGLGVISTRAVVERRQQIGMLRALGFTRRAVQASFLIEASLIALLGILVGTLLGLGLSYRLVEYLGREFPEIVFAIPWGQIGGIALFAYVASMLTTFLPAWQAGRISPAEALRYE
ncbi:MAG: FtsX-like permease family protein, partial [Chloroflexota bacterium]|nr:FtsX-like permease family protein [Chloroflexota bacterium]